MADVSRSKTLLAVPSIPNLHPANQQTHGNPCTSSHTQTQQCTQESIHAPAPQCSVPLLTTSAASGEQQAPSILYGTSQDECPLPPMRHHPNRSSTADPSAGRAGQHQQPLLPAHWCRHSMASLQSHKQIELEQSLDASKAVCCADAPSSYHAACLHMQQVALLPWQPALRAQAPSVDWPAA